MSESTTIISRRKLRKIAKEVLRIGQKIFFHKRDLLTTEGIEEWEGTMLDLHATLRDKKSPGEALQEKIELVDELSARDGDLFYHKKSWVENVEMFLVAAIVVIGVRSFFLQPFIIPTNSMYPSYYGMKPRVYAYGAESPSLAQRAANKILLGAGHYDVKAKSRGKLYLKLPNPISALGHHGTQAYYESEKAFFPNGKFFVIPTNIRKYTFSIGGADHTLRVPAEFDLEDVLQEKFTQLELVQQDALHAGLYNLSEKIFERGEIALAFDLLLGDALFVDRFTYNFRKPAVGDPIVFQTGGIDEYNEKLRQDGQVDENSAWRTIGEDKYYIKRLVGTPGDRLEIQVKSPEDLISPVHLGPPGYLLRNRKPISGCNAFEGNRKATDYLYKHKDRKTPSGFPAYRATGLLSNGSSLKVPPNSFFAMGDNSPDSLDGRAWGFVPDKKVVGRALLVYYPFTKRWGISD